MAILDGFDFVTTWAFRIGLVALGAGIVLWLATVFIKLAVPPAGIALPAVEIVGGSRTGQGQMLTHLLGAQLRQIRDDFTRSVRVLNENLGKWQSDLANLLKQEQREASKGPVINEANQNFAATAQQISQPKPRIVTDPAVLERGLQHLRLFAESLGSTKAPEIRVSGVDLGSVLQWLADRLLPKSEHSLMLVEDGQGSVVLLSGPLFGDSTVDIDLGATSSLQSPKDIVEPIAYHVLATSLRALPENSIDLGDWQAIRYFVRGLTGFADDSAVPEPDTTEGIEVRKKTRADIIGSLLLAADKVRTRNTEQARDIVSFAAFFAGQIGGHDQEADILERNAALFGGGASAETLMIRISLARKRALTFAVNAAVRAGTPGGGAGLTTVASKLTSHPTIIAARKRHHLKGALTTPANQAVRVAIVGSVPPTWMGFNIALPLFRSDENMMSTYVGGLAQVIRALTPNVSLTFYSLGDNKEHQRGMAAESDVVAAIEKIARSDAQIVVVPLGPLRGKAVEAALSAMAATGKLIILPAGNEGNRDPQKSHDPELAKLVLYAASISPDGSLSTFSDTPEGALAVIGEDLPLVIVEDDEVRLTDRDGTGPATAVLAAIAAETKIRFPDLSMVDLGKALRAAAIPLAKADIPVAIVP